MRKIIKPKKRRRYNRNNSREYRVLKSIRDLFPEDPYCYQGYWSWLPGEEGEPLQIDIFFTTVSELRNRPLAIEVQGEQHRSFVRFFHKTKEKFEHQKRNDIIKKEILDYRDIYFVEIWPEEEISPMALKEKIEKVTGIKMRSRE